MDTKQKLQEMRQNIKKVCDDVRKPLEEEKEEHQKEVIRKAREKLLANQIEEVE